MIIDTDNYNIYSGNLNIFEDLKEIVKSYSKIFVLVDQNTDKYCFSKIQSFLPESYFKIEIAAGENHKNLETCSKIWNILTEKKADRKSLLINLGGGVIGDMGGFCAATFKRGISFINIPTTLLAQVDASVGGKLGIDFMGLKNQIGVFSNPKAVFISPDFLTTISEREKMSGFAEIIKHALITDLNYWQDIQTISDNKWQDIINQSIIIKRDIVKLDPEEKNVRKKLNFGHTIGHAVESYSLENDKDPLMHGEAVAIGMICESYISSKVNNLSESELININQYINQKYKKYSIKKETYNQLFDLMKNDKKNENEKINFTLLNKIGNSDINKYADMNLIFESLDFYNNN